MQMLSSAMGAGKCSFKGVDGYCMATRTDTLRLSIVSALVIRSLYCSPDPVLFSPVPFLIVRSGPFCPDPEKMPALNKRKKTLMIAIILLGLFLF